MPKFFIKTRQIYNNYITLKNEDVKNIKDVLKIKKNEKINICDIDTSQNYICEICEINDENIKCKILEQTISKAEPNTDITIFQALPKFEKMEFIIQKCTEIGAKKFAPVIMKRCTVKLDEKSATKKIERWQKIAEAAAKQSGRDIIPEVKNIINFEKLCNLIEKYDIVLVAYEKEEENTLKKILTSINKPNLKIAIVIGPEGGIDETEISKLKKAGAKTITFGQRILRTETAAIYLTSIITYELN